MAKKNLSFSLGGELILLSYMSLKLVITVYFAHKWKRQGSQKSVSNNVIWGTLLWFRLMM